MILVVTDGHQFKIKLASIISLSSTLL